MIPAIVEIHQALLKSNYSEEDADSLVARLMEEEAFDYVKCMSKLTEEDIMKIAN